MSDHQKENEVVLAQVVLEHGLFLKALNSAASGIIITDNNQHDNPIIFCNKTFELISGYTSEEIIGHNCRFLQLADRDQDARKILWDALEAGLPCTVEIRNYKKNGDLFHNQLFISPIRNKDGKVTNFIGIQQDITEQKKAEEVQLNEKLRVAQELADRSMRLEENEVYLKSIIETIRESLLVLDGDHNVIGVNRHFCQTFKVSAQETMGENLFNLGNGQWNIDLLKAMLDRILPSSNPVLDFEVDHDFPYIGRKRMLLNAYRIELDGGYKDRILLAIEDVTEKRLLEIRKDDFLAIASHELRTPLTTIKGYIQAARNLAAIQDAPLLVTMLDKTEKSIARLNQLITEMLDVSRIETGKRELTEEVCDFDSLVELSVKDFRQSVPGRNVTLNGSTGASLTIDEGQIRQVISNLLSNSLKYSPDQSGINVVIGKVGNFVKLSVVDQGIGVTSEDQKYLFDRFFRSPSIQNKYPGMGIGLYICHQIITNHKGTLWLEHSSGEGSTFSFTLPANQ